MNSIVITGSTRGIGYGLAREFLERSCQVTINGRSQAGVDKALDQLSTRENSERLHGCAGDVTSPADHQALWHSASQKFGKVDIWINNAGIGHPMMMVADMPIETIERVVDVDLKGVIFGSKIAIEGMLSQGFGHLYNMEGFGSDGRTRPGLSVYGSTKSAVRFLSNSLTKEVEETPVKVSTLSPGMVITDFILDQYEDDPQGLEEAKKIFNILGDQVETVTPWLAEKVLSNERSGAHFAWLTPGKVTKRFMTSRFNKRDLFV